MSKLDLGEATMTVRIETDDAVSRRIEALERAVFGTTSETVDELPPVDVEELAKVMDTAFAEAKEGHELIAMARDAVAYFQSHRAAD